MPDITNNMGLYVWDLGDDKYDHDQLANNMYALDDHDHTPGKGRRIGTNALSTAAVTTDKIADHNVTRAKLANGIIGPSQLDLEAVITSTIADEAVTQTKIADNAVGFGQLALNVRPIGEIVAWWRPNTSTPVPDGWEIADGSAITDHDFPGGGTITLPDLRNRFLLGASTGGTGTGPGTPPGIGALGGSHSANLSHTHTVAHNHTVPGHSHTVQPHAHNLKPHTHGVPAHYHTVDNHTHVVGPHTHPVSSHTHTMTHSHTVDSHNHGINDGGTHTHSFEGTSVIVGFRNIELNPNGVALSSLTAGSLNHGDYLHIADAGSHDHGGHTTFSSPGTSNSPTNTGAATATASGNSNFSTAGATPNTDSKTLTTSAQGLTSGEGTENATVDTYDSAPFATSTSTPTTSSALSSTDIRPGFVGVLYLIKVKNS